MAGSPRKRANREASQGGDSARVPDARPGVTPAGATPAYARVRATPTPIRSTTPGPDVRRTADRAQATAAGALAEQLAPGTIARIERTKPTWCAGWLEDFTLEDGESGELREYIREEYGGRSYKLTMLAADLSVMWSTRIAIAGKPKMDGRDIDRDEWEGVTSKAATAPAAATGEAGLLAIIMPMFDKMMDVSKGAAVGQLEAVREAVAASERNQTKLMGQLVAMQSEERQSQSLSGQLEALADSSRAVREIGEQLAPPAAPGETEPDGGILAGASKEAVKHFVSNAMASMAPGGGPPGAPPGAPPAAPRRPREVRQVVRRKSTPGAPSPAIPDAIER